MCEWRGWGIKPWDELKSIKKKEMIYKKKGVKMKRRKKNKGINKDRNETFGSAGKGTE